MTTKTKQRIQELENRVDTLTGELNMVLDLLDIRKELSNIDNGRVFYKNMSKLDDLANYLGVQYVAKKVAVEKAKYEKINPEKNGKK